MNSKLKTLLLSFFSFLIVLFVFFPTLLSTKPGKALLLKIISYKTESKLSIENVSLTWLGPQQIDYLYFSGQQTRINLDHFYADLKLWELVKLFRYDFSPLLKNAKNWEVKNGNYADKERFISLERIYGSGDIHPKNTGAQVSFRINAEVPTQKREGKISLAGDLFSPEKKVFWDQLKGEITLQAQNISSSFFPVKDPHCTQALLGEFFSLTSKLHWQQGKKPLSISFQSENLSTDFPAFYEKGLLSFSQEITFHFQVTDSLSKYVLKDLHPLFFHGLRSLTPASVVISPEKATFPIYPFSWDKIQIPKGELNMGQIESENQGLLSLILNLLKARSLFSSPKLTLWFAPCSFSVLGSDFHMGRLDFLVDTNLHFLTGGNVNWKTEELDLYFAAPLVSLQKLFKLKSLPANSLFSFSIQGTTDCPKMKTKEIAAQVASLLLSSKLNPYFSEFFPKDVSEKIPPPTLPFPWEEP